MEHTTIAVDLAKSVLQVAVSRRPGHVDEERRLSRARFLTYLAQQTPATVVLEACGSAHYWGRQRQPLGHAVRLLPAHDVHRYVRRNKTDRTDTKALLEANRNEEIRPVPVKSVEQQAIASLHRLRSTWHATRTARLNTVRGLLREFGVIIPVGAAHVAPQVRACLAQPATPIPRLLHGTLTDACEEIRELETRLREVDRHLAVLASEMPDVTVLQTVPGVGLITATALVASVGDIRRFRSGRHFASYLGLTPKEDSTALHRRLGAISKQGDVYLRMLLIHGARSVLCHAKACANPCCNTGRCRRSSVAGTTSLLWRSRISSPGSCGLSGTSSDRLRPGRAAHSDRPRSIRFRRRTALSSIARWHTGRTGAGLRR